MTKQAYGGLSERVQRKRGKGARDFGPRNLTEGPLRHQSVGSASGWKSGRGFLHDGVTRIAFTCRFRDRDSSSFGWFGCAFAFPYGFFPDDAPPGFSHPQMEVSLMPVKPLQA